MENNMILDALREAEPDQIIKTARDLEVQAMEKYKYSHTEEGDELMRQRNKLVLSGLMNIAVSLDPQALIFAEANA